jgi:hypothetical protein
VKKGKFHAIKVSLYLQGPSEAVVFELRHS